MYLAAVICALHGISADEATKLFALKAFDNAFLFERRYDRRRIAREIAQLFNTHRADIFQNIDNFTLLLCHRHIVRTLAQAHHTDTIIPDVAHSIIVCGKKSGFKKAFRNIRRNIKAESFQKILGLDIARTREQIVIDLLLIGVERSNNALINARNSAERTYYFMVYPGGQHGLDRFIVCTKSLFGYPPGKRHHLITKKRRFIEHR